MPHRCVHCGTIYADGAEQILKGCNCGSRFFFYLTKDKLEKIKALKEEVNLTEQEKQRIKEDVRDIIGLKEEDDAPIVLDFESIKVLKPGKYAIDLHNLFNRDRPLVYTLEEGKYVVDLTSQAFKQHKSS